jgi:hypothetical protein
VASEVVGKVMVKGHRFGGGGGEGNMDGADAGPGCPQKEKYLGPDRLTEETSP